MNHIAKCMILFGFILVAQVFAHAQNMEDPNLNRPTRETESSARETEFYGKICVDCTPNHAAYQAKASLRKQKMMQTNDESKSQDPSLAKTSGTK